METTLLAALRDKLLAIFTAKQTKRRVYKLPKSTVAKHYELRDGSVVGGNK